ncbi:MAG TPA: hypothetical protein VMF30_09095 [Pirellulales bacterium]|nr:hypothetical protein [Pirellulales bacterium]
MLTILCGIPTPLPILIALSATLTVFLVESSKHHAREAAPAIR